MPALTFTDPRQGDYYIAGASCTGKPLHYPIAVALHHGDGPLAMRLADQLDLADPADRKVLRKSVLEAMDGLFEDRKYDHSHKEIEEGRLPRRETAILLDRALGGEARAEALRHGEPTLYADLVAMGVADRQTFGSSELHVALRTGGVDRIDVAVAGGSRLPLTERELRSVRRLGGESMDGLVHLAAKPDAPPSTRLAAWCVLAGDDAQAGREFRAACPPIPDRLRDRMTAMADGICQRHPDATLRVLAAIAAAAEPEQAVDQQFIEAAAGLARPGADAGAAWSAVAAQQAASGDPGSAAYATARADQAAGRAISDDVPANGRERALNR